MVPHNQIQPESLVAVGLRGATERGFGEDLVYTGRQLAVTRTLAPAGLRFSGEIDATNVETITDTLRSNQNGGDLHVDL